MKRPRVMKNNPAFLERDELMQAFVVRQTDLELIAERLRDDTARSNQHILVIGPRGMGKTTLVLRVVAEIESNPALSNIWFPIVFGEESYEVLTAAELWLQALLFLETRTGDQEWRVAYDELKTERDEQRLYERALGRLMDFADRHQKKLLFVVENLNMILGEQLSNDEGWTLRHTLQNEPRVMVLATATSRFEQIDNVGMAMYDLFWTFDLLPLTEDECRVLWHSITGHDLVGKRIRPVHILTGGSPRLVSILASFAADMSLRELMMNLAHLVDDHTSYFKSNLEILPPAERKVYVTLADLWSPAATREVALAARIDVNKASALLHRLTQRGAVTEAERQGKTIKYQVTERLYNIYHLMRKHSGGEQRVRAVVDFMVGFYDSGDIVEATRSIAREAVDVDDEARRDHFHAYRGILARLGEDTQRKILTATDPRFFAIEDAPEFIREFGQKRSAAVAEADRLVDHALTLFAEGHVAEAEANLLHIIEGHAESVRAWSELSRMQLLLQKLDKAETSARRALQHDSRASFAWKWLSLSLLMQNAYTDECERALRHALHPARGDDSFAVSSFFLISQYCAGRVSSASDAELAAERYRAWNDGHELFLAALSLHVCRQNWVELLEPAERWARLAAGDGLNRPYGAFSLAFVLGAKNQWDAALTIAGQFLQHETFIRFEPENVTDFFVRATAAGFGTESLVLLAPAPITLHLEPLVTALQMLTGKSPQAPHEVAEVAKDITKRVEELRSASSVAMQQGTNIKI